MKILVVSDSILHGTGFGKQAREIARYLASRNHDVHVLGWQYLGAVFNHPTERWTLYGVTLTEKYASNTVPRLIKKLKPDVIISLGDFFMMTPIAASRRDAFWIMQFTLDSEPFLPEFKQLINVADIPVTMSKFSESLCIKNETDVRYIPHVYSKYFYRMKDEDRLLCKTHLGDEWGFEIDEDDVVFCTIARPTDRKNLQYLIKVMSEVYKKRPNIKWYLHTNPEDPHRVFDVTTELYLRDIHKITLVPDDAGASSGIPDWELNKRINGCDINILLTGGEGFGVTTIETGITGIPSILTDYTTSKELIEGRGELVKVLGKRWKYMGMPPDRRRTKMKYAIPDIDDAVDKVISLVDNIELRERLGKRMMKFVYDNYDPDKILPKWDRLIRQCDVNIEPASYETSEVLSNAD